MALKTLVFYDHLMQLIAHENFTKFSSHKSYKSICIHFPKGMARAKILFKKGIEPKVLKPC
jgi:hypothetical protein